MYFVSVVLQEGSHIIGVLCSTNVVYPNYLVPPLLVVEFLHRIMDIFTEYFNECTEQRIKEHYVTVYEVIFKALLMFKL